MGAGMGFGMVVTCPGFHLQVAPRQRQKNDYNKSLKRRYEHMPEIRRIDKCVARCGVVRLCPSGLLHNCCGIQTPTSAIAAAQDEEAKAGHRGEPEAQATEQGAPRKAWHIQAQARARTADRQGGAVEWKALGSFHPCRPTTTPRLLFHRATWLAGANYATDAGCDFLVMMRCRRLHRTHDARQASSARFIARVDGVLKWHKHCLAYFQD